MNSVLKNGLIFEFDSNGKTLVLAFLYISHIISILLRRSSIIYILLLHIIYIDHSGFKPSYGVKSYMFKMESSAFAPSSDVNHEPNSKKSYAMA